MISSKGLLHESGRKVDTFRHDSVFASPINVPDKPRVSRTVTDANIALDMQCRHFMKKDEGSIDTSERAVVYSRIGQAEAYDAYVSFVVDNELSERSVGALDGGNDLLESLLELRQDVVSIFYVKANKHGADDPILCHDANCLSIDGVYYILVHKPSHTIQQLVSDRFIIIMLVSVQQRSHGIEA